MVVPWDLSNFMVSTANRNTAYARDPNAPVIAAEGELAAVDNPDADEAPFMTDVSYSAGDRKRQREEDDNATRAAAEEKAAPSISELTEQDFVAYQYSEDQVTDASRVADFGGCSHAEMDLCFGIGKVVGIHSEAECHAADTVRVHKWRCPKGDPNGAWCEGQTDVQTNWYETVARTSIFCVGITWKSGGSRTSKKLDQESIQSIGERPFIAWDCKRKARAKNFTLVAT
jgi:hypothetical protein